MLPSPMPRPFNINIFAAEGTPDGVRVVSKDNWNGRVIVCPRGRYPEAKRKRDEFERSGVYILHGRDDATAGPTLYIGESDTVRARLDGHYAEKDFWRQAVICTTKGDPLNKAETQYLESRLVQSAKENNRCRLDNQNNPQTPSLSEEDEARIAGYLEELLPLLPLLGIDAFVPVEKTPANRLYYCKVGSGGQKLRATGRETGNGFMVLKGSEARKDAVKSMKTSPPGKAILRLREELESSGILVEKDGRFRFEADHEFNSPSQAASVCTGRPSNGLTEWKDEKGDTLKTNRERETKEF